MGIEGLQLIKHFEGCRLEAYQDSAGVWTIGYGHTSNVFKGMKINEVEATHFLYADLLMAEIKVDNYLKVPLKQYEKDALISNAYNLSTRSVKKLIEYVNESKDLYLHKLLLYHKDAKGNPLLGLKRRREAESYLFQGKTWKEIKNIIEVL